MNFPDEVTLVMTGPLTNLALAVKKCPQITKLVKEVIFMGGVVQGVGNVTPTSEYNTYVDPEAAKIVLQAGFESITQVGLDVTRKVLLDEEHIQLIQNDALADYISESTSDYRKRYFERNGIWACAMHDPLAVAIALQNDLVTREEYYVDVETKSEICDGQMVCDFQNRLNKPPNAHVCLDVNAEVVFRPVYSHNQFINNTNRGSEVKKRYLYLLLLPGVLFLTIFMIIPILLTIGTTFFTESGFSIQGYLDFFRDRYFIEILLTTLRVSLFTTIICILLGFPAAYYISKLKQRKK